MPSPAEELRSAAQKLRDTAAKTSPGRWRIVKHNRRKLPVIANAEIHKGDRAYSISLKVPHNLADNEWAVLASPALAEPLANWLEDTADDIDAAFGRIETSCQQYAVEVAALILGEAE